MRVLRLHLGSRPLRLGRPVITIGNFDGVHLGHQKIIRRAKAVALARDENLAVISFDPHPVKVLAPDAGFRCISSLEQKLRDLAALGVDVVALLRFDEALRRATPEEFATSVIAHSLAAGAVLVGPTFRFGHGRAGNFTRLEALGRTLGFDTRAVPPLRRGGAPVSSTRVRDAIVAGDVALATKLLGRPLTVEGAVVRGRGRGRAIGMPTANLASQNELLPAPGVYASRVSLDGTAWRGATFIGEPLTFGQRETVFETHILDFPDRDLYGSRLAVSMVARLRGPVKFGSPAELVAAIRQDLLRARRLVRLEAQ